MLGIISEQDFDPLQGLISHSEGISLLPSNNLLAGIEVTLVPIIGRETVLKQYIDKVRGLFDHILLDTAPTLDLLTVNSLAAADSVITPIAPKFLDAKGMELLLKSILSQRSELTICDVLKEVFFHKNHSIENEDEFIEYLLTYGTTHEELKGVLNIPLRTVRNVSKRMGREDL